ncbi:hinge domain of cleavage stimulation factor subunit 2-domain-containing protein [Mycena olivaceomarginata]|nr:hinge domain of cleavage stimulation factor subunit 2-domain-containing protein [Mycena olivaceomarginata]
MPQSCSSALKGKLGSQGIEAKEKPGPIPHDSTPQSVVTRTRTASGSMSGLTGSQSQPSKNRAALPEGCEILDTVPDGTPILLGDTAESAITQVVAGMSPSQLIEVLAQMKAFVITHPQRARQLLLHHPQIAYAVFMGLIISKIIPFDILTRMLEANRSPISPPHIRVETPNPPYHCVAPSQLQKKIQVPSAGCGAPESDAFATTTELYGILKSTEINVPQAVSNSQMDDDETDGKTSILSPTTSCESLKAKMLWDMFMNPWAGAESQ